jgi:hypothetical protein
LNVLNFRPYISIKTITFTVGREKYKRRKINNSLAYRLTSIYQLSYLCYRMDDFTRGNKRTSVLLVLFCTSLYLCTSLYFLVLLVLLGTSLYFLVLLCTSSYFLVLICTSSYFSVLLYFGSTEVRLFPLAISPFHCL